MAWLSFLAPFFFISYGGINFLTSRRGDVGVMAAPWEQYIPFVPWLLLPYMSIDIFYAVSLFLHRKRSQLDRHALRLLLAMLLSYAGFLLFPLRFSFAVPHAEGFNGFLQNLLLGFDKPYNQAPSLHISLLLVLWVPYAKKLHGAALLILHFWFAAIGLSVLLAYQHHFIDVWTGAVAGVLCLYLVPDPPFFWQWGRPTAAMKQIGIFYAAAAILLALTGVALMLQVSVWYAALLWPACALGMVAAAYYGLERRIFQRHRGVMRWPARIVLSPYLLGAWISYRYFSKDLPLVSRISDRVWLGAFPRKKHQRPVADWHAILDMTNEFTAPSAAAQCKKYLPVMDLIPPAPATLVRAVRWLEQVQQEGPVLVHCALGRSRSASVAACWLAWRGSEKNIESVCEHLSGLRSGIVLTREHKNNILEALHELEHPV
jgi:hypothetical protein